MTNIFCEFSTYRKIFYIFQLVVQNLLLVKLVLTKLAFPMDQCNSIEPNKNCLTNLMSLLFKHMFDPNWEIRDSCVEVVTAIAKIVKSSKVSVTIKKKNILERND